MEQRYHYAALDGLRGLAAMSVLLFHLGHWYGENWLATNAGLAVDFFFCLSGYVLSIAYRAKFDAGLDTRTFLRIRAVRLVPVIIVGTLISAAYLFARGLGLGDDAISLAEVALATVLGMACLPMFTASAAIGGPQVFPLNGPQYTLFLELVVNIIWALTQRIESLWTAIAIVVISYTLTAIYGFAGDDVATFWTGFPRVLGAFYAGVAVFCAQRRYTLLTDPRWGRLFVPLLGLSFILFYWPTLLWFPIAWSWSLLVSPLLVISGARVMLVGATRRTALALGELSYPVYALHYPIFVWVNAVYQQLLGRRDTAICSVLVVIAVVIGSTLVLKLVDEPTRAWISRNLRAQGERRAAQAGSTELGAAKGRGQIRRG